MTDAQALLLNLLRGWLDLTGGSPPTLREIADQLGYSSTGLVWRDLMALRDLGLVDWEPGDETSLRVTTAGLHQSTDIESKHMAHHSMPSQTGAQRNRCAGSMHDAQIIAGFQAGLSRTAIGLRIGRSKHFVTDRLISHGLVPGSSEGPWDSAAPHIAKEQDDQYVAACLERGGFLYRTIVGGRMVEVRP